jgi:hypothetical protein
LVLNADKILFHASLPYMYQEAIFNTTPIPNHHSTLSAYITIAKLWTFRIQTKFSFHKVAFRSRRGNQTLNFFLFVTDTNSSCDGTFFLEADISLNYLGNFEWQFNLLNKIEMFV